MVKGIGEFFYCLENHLKIPEIIKIISVFSEGLRGTTAHIILPLQSLISLIEARVQSEYACLCWSVILGIRGITLSLQILIVNVQDTSIVVVSVRRIQWSISLYKLNVPIVGIVGIVANTEVEDIKRPTLQINDKRYSL